MPAANMQCRYAKSARGALARYVATRGLDSPDGLRDFTGCSNEWSFDARASTSDVFVFKRSVSQKKDTKTSAASGVKIEVAEGVSTLKKAVLPRAATATARATTKPAAAVQKSDARPAITRSVSKLKSSTTLSAAKSKRSPQKKNSQG
jgi:hypothetical protein